MAFTDNFAGTSGDKLYLRAGWSKLGPGTDSHGPELNGNFAIKGALPNTESAPAIGQNIGDPDHYVQAKVYTGFATEYPPYNRTMLVARYSAGSFYGVSYNSVEGCWELIKNTNRARTYVTPFASGTVLRLEVEESNVKVFIDNVERISFTDSAPLDGENGGVFVRGEPGADPVLGEYESGPLTPPVDPPTGVITSQTVRGQKVTLSGTSENVPTSGQASLIAVGSGAVTQGPVAVTLGDGTWSAEILLIQPGEYSPLVTLTNAGGTADATGGSNLTVARVTGGGRL